MSERNISIRLYQTQFQRGQRDVSSNVAAHLSRLSYEKIERPPFLPRREFSLTFAAATPSYDVASYNYAAITFPTTLLGTITDEWATLYYFVECDIDAPDATTNCRVLRFTLDEWACVTSFAGAPRSPSDAILQARGTLVAGHQGAARVRLGGTVAPSDSLYSVEGRVTLVTGDGVVLVAVCEEATVNQTVKTRMFALCDYDADDADPASLLSSLIVDAQGTAATSLSASLERLLSQLDTSQWKVVATDGTSSYQYGALTILKVYALPASMLTSAYIASWGAYARDKNSDTPASGVRKLVALGGIGDGVTALLEKPFTIPSAPDTVYTFGNVAQRMTFPPASLGRRAFARVLLRPSTGTVAVYISDGLQEMEVTETLAMPTAEIADELARETQGIRDVLAAVSVAGGLAVGIATQNPIAVASGVMSAAQLTADVTTRTYAAQRQTVGGAFRNVCANTSGTSAAIAGCVRVESYAPANQGALTNAFSLYGWGGERPCGVVTPRPVYGYWQYADDVALTLDGVLLSFPWMAEAIRQLLIDGVRVWNDEDTTRFKDYNAAQATDV